MSVTVSEQFPLLVLGKFGLGRGVAATAATSRPIASASLSRVHSTAVGS
jgi:hypothetical protein